MAAVELFGFDCGVVEESGEGDGRLHHLQLGHEGAEVRADRLPEVLEDDAARFAIELNRTAGGEIREAAVDLLFDLAARGTGERPIAQVEAEIAMSVANEVEHRQAVLVAAPSQTAAELLKKDERALGRPEKEDRVDLRHVDAFIEDVDREEAVDLAVAQAPERAIAYVAVRRPQHRLGRNPSLIEAARHELGVADADAEAEGAHAAEIADLSAELLHDLHEPRIVARVDVLELAIVVTAAGPCHVRDVDVVVDAEIVERREQAAIESFPEPELDRDPVIEPLQDRFAVRSLRRRGETEEDFGR